VCIKASPSPLEPTRTNITGSKTLTNRREVGYCIYSLVHGCNNVHICSIHMMLKVNNSIRNLENLFIRHYIYSQISELMERSGSTNDKKKLHIVKNYFIFNMN
jgi:hypothetical protein